MIPPTHFLVGVDFSESSRVALAFASRLALRVGGKLDVVHVLDSRLCTAAREARTDLAADAAEELQRFVHDTPPANRAQVNALVSCGSAALVVCDIAAREGADILIVGSHGMSGAAHGLFGSTTDAILRLAHMSVLVVPAEWRPLHPETNDLAGLGPVLAAVDFSEPAIGAAYAAARLARLLNTSLTVLHVVPEMHVIERWAAYAEGAMTESARAARRELEGALARVKTIAPMDLHVVTGDVIGSILRAAQPTGACAPLLVLGRRPHEARDGSAGTVVARALASLRSPMLVLSPAEGASDA